MTTPQADDELGFDGTGLCDADLDSLVLTNFLSPHERDNMMMVCLWMAAKRRGVLTGVLEVDPVHYSTLAQCSKL